LIALCQSAGVEVPHSVLRAPEIGTVMVRGRAGAVGAAFNLGEMTVTRASVRLTESGAVGHGYVQGRSHEAATYAALVDALCQTDQGSALIASVITPLRAEKAAREGARAVRAAGTKVEFFTMVRGE
jgi:alpha-D-ribose 1-methylphosphonate 5-triphosphate synthase subunit PhnG